MGTTNWKNYGKLSQYKCVAKVDTAILTEERPQLPFYCCRFCHFRNC